MHPFNLFFAWPDGAVWGNIVATLVTSLPVWLVGYFKLKHKQQKHHKELTDHITRQITKLTESNKQ